MTTEEVMKLYKKEREYQKSVFGNYSDQSALNISSFLVFIEQYIEKAKEFYVNKWTKDLPPWLVASRESIVQKTCPVDTYKELIKIMALAGAALESYTKIDVEQWRSEGINKKWEDNK